MLFFPKQERALNRLLLGDALTTIIDQLVLLAIPTLALSLAGLSAQQVSILTAAQWMPALILGGWFGHLVDTHGRRSIMALAGLLAAGGACAMLLVGSIAPGYRNLYLLTTDFLYACGATLYQVSAAANVPRAVVHVSIADAVSRQASIRNVARVTGLAVAGPVVQFIGILPSFALAALLSLARTAIVATLPSQPEEAASRQKAQTDSRSAWAITWRSAVLRRILIANSTMSAGSAMILGAFFAFAYQVLRLTPFQVGAMLFVGGAAAILTAWQIKRLQARLDAKWLCALSGLGAGSAVWLIPASAHLPTLPTLFCYEALFSSLATVFAVTFAIVRQSVVPHHLLGKLVAVSSTANAAALVLGSLAGAIVIGKLGLSAAVCLGCGLSSLGSLSLIRMTRSDPNMEASLA